MKNYAIYPYQNDLVYNDNISYNKIKVIKKEKNKSIYKTIIFEDINNDLINTIKKEILYFLLKKKINKKSHILVIGMGNDFYTPDSVGPNTLKHIKVNSYLENLGIKSNVIKVSTLKPGVLGETGILSEKVISSVSKEIKPDFIIIIDSFITNDIKYLNHTIELNDYGISPGHGIKKINSFINEKTLNIPILVIGITTAILVKFDNSSIPYILSCKDIDAYVLKISEIIGNSINIAIDDLN